MNLLSSICMLSIVLLLAVCENVNFLWVTSYCSPKGGPGDLADLCLSDNTSVGLHMEHHSLLVMSAKVQDYPNIFPSVYLQINGRY